MSDEQVKGTEVNASQEVPQTPKRKLGISKDTVGGSTVPIPAPYELDKPTPQFETGYHFPIAKLSAVAYIPNKETKLGERQVLSFIFKDEEKRQYNHIEFPIDEDDAKFESKLEWLQQRLKHIWDETIGESLFPADGLGTNAETFGELYEDTAKKFNAAKTGEGDLAVPVYTKTPVYIKLTYNKDRVQFPLFPNFVQRAVVGGKPVPVTNLSITPSRDKVKPPTSASTASYGGGAETSFGGAANTFKAGDFPDV